MGARAPVVYVAILFLAAALSSTPPDRDEPGPRARLAGERFAEPLAQKRPRAADGAPAGVVGPERLPQASGPAPTTGPAATRSSGSSAGHAGFGCLPSCDVTDARLLLLTGEGGLASLNLGTQEFGVAVPPGAASFVIGIFDGDTAATDGNGDSHWDLVTPAVTTYTLFADPLGDGTGTSVVMTVDGSTLPDNEWADFTVATSAAAQSPSGGFFYRLRASFPSGTPGNASNGFKLRTSDVITVAESTVRPYAFMANITSIADAEIVFPDFPDPTPTHYDGVFSFFFEIFDPDGVIEIWDGDLDRGKFDGTESDTDDPNTPASPLPPWSASSTAPEGVATGTGPSTGAPPDDREGGGLSDLFLRSPSIRYDLIFPDGRVFANDNPSGNVEWEKFSVTDGPFDPSQHDYATSTLPSGIYEVRVEGADMSNQNLFVFPRASLCVLQTGAPCQPRRPFRLGDTVFLDTDGDGLQDFGEIGLAGVDLDLLGAGGGSITDATSGGGGQYSFEVEAGSYSVDVPAANLGAGGALQGMVATVANTLDATIVDDNDLTLDFGYRHVAPPGTGTQGFWKTHPEAWPVASLEIGGVLYQQAELLDLMDRPTRGDVTLVMLAQVVAARLNVASGTDSSCVSAELEAADDWLAAHPPGSGLKANSPAWRGGGEALKDHLDAYNNGELCAPHRG